jgi:hypothetical protein
MDRGDVLQLTSGAGDLTGSLVEADGPVQVIGGHYAARVPLGQGDDDHLEESILPVETLGGRYVATAPALATTGEASRHIVRVVAAEADTTLRYEPAITGLPTSIAGRGDFVELVLDRADLYIEADKKVLVVEYLESEEVVGVDDRNPNMSVAVPVQQFRTDYLFHAPTNYEQSYVNIVAPMGATVTLDGDAVTGFTPIGASGFGVVRVQLTHDTGGTHTASGDEPFGISVYGYGEDTSYRYPGGLDLEPIELI